MLRRIALLMAGEGAPAITHVNTSIQKQAASGTMTINIPSGAKIGDIAVMSHVHNDGENSTPSGWTRDGTDSVYAAFYHRTLDSLSSFSLSAGQIANVVTISIFRLASFGSFPLMAYGFSAGAPNSPSAPGAIPYDVALSIGLAVGVDDSSVTPPPGYELLGADGVTNGGSANSAMIAMKRVSESGTEDPGAWSGVTGTAWRAGTYLLNRV